MSDDRKAERDLVNNKIRSYHAHSHFELTDSPAPGSGLHYGCHHGLQPHSKLGSLLGFHSNGGEVFIAYLFVWNKCTHELHCCA